MLEQKLAEYLANTSYEDIPPETINTMRRCVIDTLGVMSAGSSAPQMRELLEWLKASNSAREASAIVFGDKLSVSDAAWINGAMTRAREFDDSHDGSGDHSSTPVLAAGLAIAEYTGGVSGKDFLAAYALATDFVIRLRRAPNKRVGAPSVGFAANAYAPFSAAVMAARLLKLDANGMYNTLGWAYAQMAGAVQVQQCGSSVLQVQHGLAAACGVKAALLAKAGFPGVEGFLTGKFGLFNAYERGDYNPEAVTEGLGERFFSQDIAIKCYPCGRIIQAPVVGALELRGREGFEIENAEKIEIWYTTGGVNMTCQPEERHFPSCFQHAKFSLYYGVASALLRGRLGIEDYSDEAINDPRIRKIIEKIVVHPDASLGYEMPPGILRATMKDGTVFETRTPLDRGTMEHPFTLDECFEKFRYCMGFAARPIAPERLDEAEKLLRRFDELEDVGVLLQYFNAALQ